MATHWQPRRQSRRQGRGNTIATGEFRTSEFIDEEMDHEDKLDLTDSSYEEDEVEEQAKKKTKKTKKPFKPLTADQKEKNRLAAARCRARKLKLVSNTIQARDRLAKENAALHAKALELEEELHALRTAIAAYVDLDSEKGQEIAQVVLRTLRHPEHTPMPGMEIGMAGDHEQQGGPDIFQPRPQERAPMPGMEQVVMNLPQHNGNSPQQAVLGRGHDQSQEQTAHVNTSRCAPLSRMFYQNGDKQYHGWPLLRRVRENRYEYAPHTMYEKGAGQHSGLSLQRTAGDNYCGYPHPTIFKNVPSEHGGHPLQRIVSDVGSKSFPRPPDPFFVNGSGFPQQIASQNDDFLSEPLLLPLVNEVGFEYPLDPLLATIPEN